ncbi:MAG: hypothetical protein R3B09_31070 [Nannocystaceae bacterium]
MSTTTPRHPLTLVEVVLAHPDRDAVIVRRDLELAGADGRPIAVDLYLPPASTAGATPPPAVILASGYPDDGFQALLGCRFKEMAGVTSWARLLAASGVAAITYANREPLGDLRALLAGLRRGAEPLGIDGDRLGLWASSGNAPVALAAVIERPPGLRAAALLYGFLLDLEGEAAVAEASRQFGFVDACAGRSLAELPRETPLLLVRAGGDATPGLLGALDRLVVAGLAADLPLTICNCPGAAHAFDLADGGAASIAAIRQVVDFLAARLADTRE